MPRRDEPHPYAARIGARIRDLRLERGLSFGQLADSVAHLSKGALSSIEHGYVNVTIDTLERIARGLGVEPFDVLCLPDESPRAALIERLRLLPPEELHALIEFTNAEGASPASRKKRPR